MVRKPLGALLVAVVMVLIAASCGKKKKDFIVMCGAANRPPVEEIAKLFESARGVHCTIVAAGSGILVSQMKYSKKGDIYVAGSPDFMKSAEKHGLIFPDSVREAAYFIPGIIVATNNPKKIRTIENLARPGVRVALANTDTVACGRYAAEILHRSGLLPAVMKNVVTFGASAPKIFELLLFGRADAILGWKVMETWAPGKTEFVSIEKSKVVRVSYIAAGVPKSAGDRALSAAFIDLVLSEEGRRVYKKHGYVTDRKEALRYCSSCLIGGNIVLPENIYRYLK